MILEGQIVSEVEKKKLPTGTRRASFIIFDGKKRVSCVGWKAVAKDVVDKVTKGEKMSFKGFMDDKKDEFIVQEVLSSQRPAYNLKNYLYSGYEDGRAGYIRDRDRRIKEMKEKGLTTIYIKELQPGVCATSLVPTASLDLYVDVINEFTHSFNYENLINK